MSAKHNNLLEAFVSEFDVPIAEIGFDLSPMIEKGYTVGVLRQAERAWWFLFDCLKKESLRTMVRQAGSPSKAFRTLRDHFMPLSESQIRIYEEKLNSLRIRSNENPSTFFTALRETLGVLQMLGVTKSDRDVCNVILAGLPREYENTRENLNTFCKLDPIAMDVRIRDKYLDLLAQKPKKDRGVALAAVVRKTKTNKSKPPAAAAGASKVFKGRCFKCNEKGHMAKDCKARVFVHPCQAEKSEDGKEDDSGEHSVSALLSHAQRSLSLFPRIRH